MLAVYYFVACHALLSWNNAGIASAHEMVDRASGSAIIRSSVLLMVMLDPFVDTAVFARSAGGIIHDQVKRHDTDDADDGKRRFTSPKNHTTIRDPTSNKNGYILNNPSPITLLRQKMSGSNLNTTTLRQLNVPSSSSSSRSSSFWEEDIAGPRTRLPRAVKARDLSSSGSCEREDAPSDEIQENDSPPSSAFKVTIVPVLHADADAFEVLEDNSRNRRDFERRSDANRRLAGRRLQHQHKGITISFAGGGISDAERGSRSHVDSDAEESFSGGRFLATSDRDQHKDERSKLRTVRVAAARSRDGSRNAWPTRAARTKSTSSSGSLFDLTNEAKSTRKSASNKRARSSRSEHSTDSRTNAEDDTAASRASDAAASSEEHKVKIIVEIRHNDGEIKDEGDTKEPQDFRRPRKHQQADSIIRKDRRTGRITFADTASSAETDVLLRPVRKRKQPRKFIDDETVDSSSEETSTSGETNESSSTNKVQNLKQALVQGLRRDVIVALQDLERDLIIAEQKRRLQELEDNDEQARKSNFRQQTRLQPLSIITNADSSSEEQQQRRRARKVFVISAGRMDMEDDSFEENQQRKRGSRQVADYDYPSTDSASSSQEY